jgi:AP endonuclease-1
MDLVMDRVPHVMLVIENMAGQGNVIGSTFEEIKSIMDLVQDKHKSRVGVCLDTAHCHGAGLDCTTPAAYAAMMAKFDAIIGMKHLRGMHLNDSKANLGSKRDLHQYLGRGHIGMEAFRSIMNDKRLTGIPLILETPSHDDKDTSVYKGEIAMLYSLIGTLAGAPCALPHLPAGALEANMDADGKIPGKRKKEEAEGEEGEAQPKKGKKGDAPEEGAGAPAPAAKKAGKGVAK